MHYSIYQRFFNTLLLPRSSRLKNTIQLKNFSKSSHNQSNKNEPRNFISAWQIHNYGKSQDQLQFTDKLSYPIIHSNEILVEVKAVSLNPIDLLMLQGYGSEIFNQMRFFDSNGLNVLQKLKFNFSKNFNIEFPIILGRDFSGVVVETSNSVENFKIGDEVWGALNVFRSGSLSEIISVNVKSDVVQKKPKNISHSEAAAIPYCGLTSLSAIKITGMYCNFNSKIFLILGGSGGVGTFSIQYLKSQGARVVSTCNEDARELLENIGCDKIIDYKSTNCLEQIRQQSPYDCILDMAGPGKNNEILYSLLKPIHGQYITLSSPAINYIDKYGILPGAIKSITDICLANLISLSKYKIPTKWAYFLPNNNFLDSISKFVESERIKPVIDSEFKFKDAINAFQKLEKGHLRGKIVISH